MNNADISLEEIGRKVESWIHRRAAKKRQHYVADELGMSESTLSRFLAGEAGIKIGDVGKLLHVLDGRVTDVNAEYVETEYLRSLKRIAREGLREEE